MEPFRDVLLTERRGGASIRLLVQSLAKLGVTISAETLRVWFLRHKLPKRRRPRKPSAKASPARPLLPASTASAAASLVPSWQRKGPRIARDQY